MRQGSSFLAVDIRHAASPWYDDPEVIGTYYVIRSSHLGQAVIGSMEGQRSFGAAPSVPNIARMIMPVPLHVSVRWEVLRFNFEQAGTTSPRAAEWLQDAQLIIASWPSAGRWRATFDVPNIRLADIATTAPAEAVR